MGGTVPQPRRLIWVVVARNPKIGGCGPVLCVFIANLAHGRCVCAGWRIRLYPTPPCPAPNQLVSQLQLWLNADLLSIKDSPEQGLVVCFGLACAGSLFGCRLGVRLKPSRWAWWWPIRLATAEPAGSTGPSGHFELRQGWG